MSQRLVTGSIETSRRGARAGERTFEMLALDVTSDESVDAAVRELLRRKGRIDLLVNSAGFGVPPAAPEESSIEQAQFIFTRTSSDRVRMTAPYCPTCERKAAVGEGRRQGR